jgi:hypothetical protein
VEWTSLTRHSINAIARLKLNLPAAKHVAKEKQSAWWQVAAEGMAIWIMAHSSCIICMQYRSKRSTPLPNQPPW